MWENIAEMQRVACPKFGHPALSLIDLHPVLAFERYKCLSWRIKKYPAVAFCAPCLLNSSFLGVSTVFRTPPPNFFLKAYEKRL